MSFFDDLPSPAERPRRTKPVPPAWAAPPSDELPAVVPVGRFLYRSATMMMAVKNVDVFSTGCQIDVVWSVRRGEDDTDIEWSRITDQCFNRSAFQFSGGAGHTGGLRFGVAYPDGSKATTAPPSPGLFDGTERVKGPLLIMTGGGGGSGNDDEVSSSTRFWLWPMPGNGDVRFVAQWNDLGMKETSIVISGDHLAKAAARVQKYWDPQDDIRQGAW